MNISDCELQAHHTKILTGDILMRWSLTWDKLHGQLRQAARHHIPLRGNRQQQTVLSLTATNSSVILKMRSAGRPEKKRVRKKAEAANTRIIVGGEPTQFLLKRGCTHVKAAVSNR